MPWSCAVLHCALDYPADCVLACNCLFPVLRCAVLCCALSSYARLCCNALSTSTRAACLQDLPPNLLPFLRLGNCSSNEGLRQHGAFLQTSDPLPPAEEAQVLQNLASCIQQRLQRLVLASICAALAPAAAPAHSDSTETFLFVLPVSWIKADSGLILEKDPDDARLCWLYAFLLAGTKPAGKKTML